jgi:hypothetical protein
MKPLFLATGGGGTVYVSDVGSNVIARFRLPQDVVPADLRPAAGRVLGPQKAGGDPSVDWWGEKRIWRILSAAVVERHCLHVPSSVRSVGSVWQAPALNRRQRRPRTAAQAPIGGLRSRRGRLLARPSLPWHPARPRPQRMPGPNGRRPWRRAWHPARRARPRQMCDRRDREARYRWLSCSGRQPCARS